MKRINLSEWNPNYLTETFKVIDRLPKGKVRVECDECGKYFLGSGIRHHISLVHRKRHAIHTGNHKTPFTALNEKNKRIRKNS